MKNLQLFELFIRGGSYTSDGDYPEDHEELLKEIVEDDKFQEEIKGHFRRRGLDISDIEVDEPDTFYIDYESNALAGEIPNRISMYLDDLAGIIAEEVGVEVDWRFAPNGNCRRAYFILSKEIDPKFLKARKIAKNN